MLHRKTTYLYLMLVWLLYLACMIVARVHFGAAIEEEGGIVEALEVVMLGLLISTCLIAAKETPWPRSIIWFSLAWVFFAGILRELSNNDWSLPEQLLSLADQKTWRKGITVTGSIVTLYFILRNWKSLWFLRAKLVHSSLPIWAGIATFFTLILAAMFEYDWFHMPYNVFMEEICEFTGYYMALCGIWLNRRLFV